jgi:hypothetical protein
MKRILKWVQYGHKENFRAKMVKECALNVQFANFIFLIPRNNLILCFLISKSD